MKIKPNFVYVLARHDLSETETRFMTIKVNSQKGFKFHQGTNGQWKVELPWIRKHANIADNFWTVVDGFQNKRDCKIGKQKEEDFYLSVPGRTIYTNLHYNNMKVRKKS